MSSQSSSVSVEKIGGEIFHIHILTYKNMMSIFVLYKNILYKFVFKRLLIKIFPPNIYIAHVTLSPKTIPAKNL